MNIEILELEDKQYLQKTQDIRNKIIDTLLVDGCIPDDEKDRRMLLDTLESIDRNIFNKAKIKSQTVQHKDNRDVIGVMTQLLLKSTQTPNSSNIIDATLGDSFVVEDINPGEDDIEENSLTYEKFISDSEDL